VGSGLRKLNSDFVTAYISEAGTQEQNRDYFGYIPMDGYICWAVAETYDNDNEILSAQIAIDTVLELFSKHPTLSKRKLRAYIKEAHRQMLLQSGNFQLKASIMVAASNYKKMRYAHCGNCRLYVFRGGNIFLKSKDQSVQRTLIERGEIPDNDENAEESRNLLSFLGKQGKIKVDVSKKKIGLSDGDILLLCTWGVWGQLSVLEMLDALEDATIPEDYLEELQDLLLSKLKWTPCQDKFFKTQV